MLASYDMVLDGDRDLIDEVREHGGELSREVLLEHVHMVLVVNHGEVICVPRLQDLW